MATEKPTEKPADRGKEGKVAAVLTLATVAINRGSLDGVQTGDMYIIYVLGDEVFDPDTKENLGMVQIVKGRCDVISVQPRLSILQGYKFEREPEGISRILLPSLPKKVVAPLEGVEVGDLVWRTNR